MVKAYLIKVIKIFISLVATNQFVIKYLIKGIFIIEIGEDSIVDNLIR